MGRPRMTATDNAPVCRPIDARLRRALAAALCSVLAGVVMLTVSAPALAAVPTVTFTIKSGARPIPDDFFGLSIEVDKLTAFADAGLPFDRMLSILRPGNGEPLQLRLGGRSADAAVWGEHPTTLPHWVKFLDATWMSDLVDLVQRDNLRIELTVNLVAHSPTMALAFAEAAKHALPRGTLAGLAIGNEPDLYRLQPRLEAERLSSTIKSTPKHWTRHYTVDTYVDDFRAYARTLTRHLGGIPLAGPELTYPSVAWPQQLVTLGSLRPASLSFHRYATATCNSKQRRAVPDAAAFLENRFSGGLARTLYGDLRFASANQIPIRVSEMNSFTCGGRAALAASFATALWAPDALFEMANVGVTGVNWHIRPELPNAPFALGATPGVTVRPEAYGLAAFARMLGPKAELLHVKNDAPDPTGDQGLGRVVKARDDAAGDQQDPPDGAHARPLGSVSRRHGQPAARTVPRGRDGRDARRPDDRRGRSLAR